MFSAAKPDDKLKTNKEAAIIRRRFNSKPSGVSNSCSFYGNTYELAGIKCKKIGFAPIFPDICYHLTHYKPAAADIPVASDN
ncbi:hypothetical protein, partial [Shigella sonnei]|uniref:hypothetical protein n=1 Tax=Shigella sonnei TaxID=624 RepID=UPI001C0A7898